MAVEMEQFKEYLKNPILFPEEFTTWITDFYATNIPKIPVSQILGFAIHKIKSVDTIGTEPTNSSSYASFCEGVTANPSGWVDLATDGPELTGLANGYYLCMYGAFTYGNTGAVRVGISKDGGTPADDEAMVTAAGHNMRLFLVDFSQGNHDHTLKMKYENTGAFGAWFSSRWVHAVKVSFDE